jgi:hypothetical protein
MGFGVRQEQDIAQAYGSCGAVVLGQLVRIKTIESQRQVALHLPGELTQRFYADAAVGRNVEGQQIRYSARYTMRATRRLTKLSFQCGRAHLTTSTVAPNAGATARGHTPTGGP